ncbi:MAG TPA: aminotransferase class IV [Gemmatimonadales bacterium]|nr:aminotransferase class IV [Gemmatimonadales bacterium]
MSGAALIETIRVRDGAAPLWRLHLRRLTESCRALGLPVPQDLAPPEGGADRVHRLEVSERGCSVTERAVGPVERVHLVTTAVAHQPYPHKTTARTQFEQAAVAARSAGADEGLLLTPAGDVAETSIWSVFWWAGDRLCAPPLALGILPGVARARIAELVPIREHQVSRGGLEGKALLLANAARGIVEVAALDGTAVPRSANTDALRERFWA